MLLLLLMVVVAAVAVFAMHQSHLLHSISSSEILYWAAAYYATDSLYPSPTFSTAQPVFSFLLILFVLWSSFKCSAGDCRPKVLRFYIQQHGFSCHLVTIISHLPHRSDTTLQLSPESIAILLQNAAVYYRLARSIWQRHCVLHIFLAPRRFRRNSSSHPQELVRVRRR
jgi:hypothetical protein